MKKKLLAGLAVGLVMLGMAGVACGDVIVDTGTPTSSSTGFSLDGEQWIALEFSLSQASTLTDIEGYMWGTAYTGVGRDTLTAAIYDTMPLVFAYNFTTGEFNVQSAQELYSSQFAVGSDPEGWYGASGLNWNLPAGTYWASFEVRTGNTYSGAMPDGAENPLGLAEMIYHPTQLGGSISTLGFRISGDPAPVPEPATMLLMGTGLAGLIGARRKKRA